MAITLILGGARSGKSQYAENLAKVSDLPVCYVATAPHIEGDKAWLTRIEHHQQQRSKTWQTIEEPLALVKLLEERKFVSSFLLIDCLTLWLNNVMFKELDTQAEIIKLCDALQQYEGEVVLVSNEVGLGLVPENELGRVFRDVQGRLNQQVAAVADHVKFIAAGLPLKLK